MAAKKHQAKKQKFDGSEIPEIKFNNSHAERIRHTGYCVKVYSVDNNEAGMRVAGDKVILISPSKEQIPATIASKQIEPGCGPNFNDLLLLVFKKARK